MHGKRRWPLMGTDSRAPLSCLANLRATQVLISRIQSISWGRQAKPQLPGDSLCPFSFLLSSLKNHEEHTHTHTHCLSFFLHSCPCVIIDSFSLTALHPSSACHSLPQGTGVYTTRPILRDCNNTISSHHHNKDKGSA